MSEESYALVKALGLAINAAEGASELELGQRLRLELADTIYGHKLSLEQSVTILCVDCGWEIDGSRNVESEVTAYVRAMSGLLGRTIPSIRKHCKP